MKQQTFFIAAAAAALLAGCEREPPVPPPIAETEAEAPAAPQTTADLLDAAIAGAHRSDANRARDEWRNPKETLLFFGLEPDMTVIELYPGGGWYTEILAPVLRERGQLVAGQFDPEQPPAYRARNVAAYDSMLASNAVYDSVEVRILQDGPDVSLGDDGSADLVLTFRNLHGWINAGEIDHIFGAAYRVLKPGGVLGVVQHRADEGADPADSARTGYVPTSYVVERAAAAGFELDAASEINANPADTKDYSIGVWALPPSLRGDMDQRDERVEIGESDRMTLRFVRPG
jgi:predicted methyltransferase